MGDATPDDYAKFREKHFSTQYLKYWRVKENNLAATIQKFPGLWKLFMDLNDILMTEFETVNPLTDEKQFVPQLLLSHAHSQFLLATELFFATCPHEAFALMRGAIESAAVAYRLFRHPKLVNVWMSRKDTKAAEKEFNKHFREDRKNKMFDGKPEFAKLHTFWVNWSEVSSHSNIADLARRTQIDSVPKAENFMVHYLERDERYVCLAAFQGLEAMALIENIVYAIFETRLKLHPALPQKRDAFAKRKQVFRQSVVKAWGLKPDGTMTK